MTEFSSHAAARAAGQAAAEQVAELQTAISRLNCELRTMEVAFEVAAQVQFFANEQITDLMLSTAFHQLAFQIRNAVESMRGMLP